MDSNVIWDLESRLIKLMRDYPHLYNPKDPEHRNTQQVEASWNTLAMELEKSTEDVKRIWQNLKDSFTKKRRLQEQSKGSPWSSSRRRYWIHMEGMSYFAPYIPSRKKRTASLSGHKDLVQNVDVSQDNVPATGLNLVMDTCSVQRPLVHSPCSSDECLDTIHKNKKDVGGLEAELMRQLRMQPEDDEYQHFLLHVAHVLRKLPPRIAVKAKMEISNIVFNAEMEALEAGTG